MCFEYHFGIYRLGDSGLDFLMMRVGQQMAKSIGPQKSPEHEDVAYKVKFQDNIIGKSNHFIGTKLTL